MKSNELLAGHDPFGVLGAACDTSNVVVEDDDTPSPHSAVRSSYVRELRPAAPLESPATEELPAAHALVAALVEAGVDTFFGVPGGPVSPLFDAVLQVSGARLIESRHETHAAFAAADYYRSSGRVPVVMVTAGPGATNVVTGVASAYLERVPMLVICGDVAWASAGGKLLQDTGPEGVAVERLLGHVTRKAIRVARPQSLVSQGLAALEAARHPFLPGPALLVVPIQYGRVTTSPTRLVSAPPALDVTPERDVVETAAEWLLDAQHPLLVLGAGCRPHAAKLRRLVDLLDVPFVTTPQAKGLVSEMHPRSLRNGGLAASIWARKYTGFGVDCALALGTDLDDCAVGPTPYVAPGGRLVHVDLDATVFNRNIPTALGVVADVGGFADELCNVWAQNGFRHGRVSRVVRALKEDPAFDFPGFQSDDSPQITPHRAVADLEAALAPDAAFITDIGEHMLFALHYLTARDPGAFTIHLGLGSMGSGIAGAVGLALGNPERPVVCICGDGGMQMAGMEALVALEHRLPIVFAVFNDARYNMVYHGYRQVYGREAKWETGWIDFAAWARSMNMAGVRINHPGEITRESLERLRAAGVPVVLDIRIDRNVRLRGGGRNESLRHMSMLDADRRTEVAR
ncbi:MAG TPA: thiamine pyrophosphate-binding protein [Polyangiaceae bacterium]|nr:thiamine pyrophosphate-binding protein [Polyangiaceae bacterium]